MRKRAGMAATGMEVGAAAGIGVPAFGLGLGLGYGWGWGYPYAYYPGPYYYATPPGPVCGWARVRVWRNGHWAYRRAWRCW